jgi:flavodoxin
MHDALIFLLNFLTNGSFDGSCWDSFLCKCNPNNCPINKEGNEMRKAFKIILAIFVVIIIIFVAFAAQVFLDLSAYTATSSKTLTPSGTSIGKALVTYDPGLSGTAKGVAEKVASDLQTQNYSVTLAGIKSSAAANTAGYTIIIVGGPIYAGSPTSSIKDCLNNLKPDQGAIVGVFGSGSGATAPEDIATIKSSVPALTNGSLTNTTVVKIGQTEDLNARAQDFVNQLVQ